MLHMGRDMVEIPLVQCDFPAVFKLENTAPLQHHDPLVFGLVVPSLCRRGLAPGQDPFDADMVRLEQVLKYFLLDAHRDGCKDIVLAHLFLF